MLYYAIKPGRITRCGIRELKWAARRDKVRHRGPAQKIARGIDFIIQPRGGGDAELESAARVHCWGAQNNCWRSRGKGDLPDALTAAIFNNVNPVTDDLRVDWIGEASDDSRRDGLIIRAP